MNFHEQEEVNGTRFSWNVFPASKIDATRIVVPLGCLYTPLKETRDLRLLNYEPQHCRTRDCNCVLNPYCSVDFRMKTWFCPFCTKKNAFSPMYAEHISEQALPAELMSPQTTIEYILQNQTCLPPVFLFVVDTSVAVEELAEIKDSIQHSLSCMPSNALVGLITYGNMCYVHELGFTEMPKSYAFRGHKDVTAQQVAYQLGFSVRNDPRGAIGHSGVRRFLLTASDCEFSLSSILDDLQPDAWPRGAEKRKGNCTGLALSVAVGLLETTYAHNPARVILLCGNPCTVGPGTIVGVSKEETIRSHLDLQKESANTKYTKDALKHYAMIATRAASVGHSIDLFCSSYDQVGLYEMRVVCDKTGGYMVMCDSFSMHVFKDSFKKIFECDDRGYLQMGFGSKTEVLCSSDLKVIGCIGSCSSLNKQSNVVADTEIGEGGTCQWLCGTCDKNTTFAYYFEIAQQQTSDRALKQSYLQFQTIYLHSSGQKRLRVTTVSNRFASSQGVDEQTGFDQEAAAVIMTRFAICKTENEDSLDVTRWVDRMLIRLVSKFADFRKDDPASFQLDASFAIFPQFMYHLRRSNFLRTFNASPDETAFCRTIMMRETVMSALVMIQPALLQYSFNDMKPQPVLLDSVSLKPDVILLLDTFFHVVIWRGANIQHWYDNGYHEMEGYQNFKQLLQAPAEDAKPILAERFPSPKFIQTNAGGSQQRFLACRVNPSQTHHSGFGDTQDSSVVITDDVSLKVFMEHLIKLAVSTS